jgi:hypothetical protein
LRAVQLFYFLFLFSLTKLLDFVVEAAATDDAVNDGGEKPVMKCRVMHGIGGAVIKPDNE